MIIKLVKGATGILLAVFLSACDWGADSYAATAADVGTGQVNTTVNSCEAAGDDCIHFTVLHTNDNHGRFWNNQEGEYGMAARKTLVDRIRNEVESAGGEVLLLSGGDINTGVPESDLQDAKPDFVGMNLIGYDAMAVGNHEFDNPLSILDKQREWAHFPMLAANIYKADGTRYFEPYKIFNLHGLKVAVIGLTTKDTAKLGNPEFVNVLTFTDPAIEIAKVIKELKVSHAADVIFATTHMGHFADGHFGSNAPGDVSMARSLTPGLLQAVFGGHSQNPVCMEPDSEDYAHFKPGDACTPDRQNGTYIMQAHEWGKYVGRADFEYYGAQLHLVDYQLIPVNLMKTKRGDNGKIVFDAEGKAVKMWVKDYIQPDKKVLAALAPYQSQGQEELDEVVAEITGMFDGERDHVRFMQTNLGQLIAQVQSQKVAADFGIMNSGGVRDSIPAGKVSYREILMVQPFGNLFSLATMSGTDLRHYLGQVAAMQSDSGGYAQITHVKMTVDCIAKSVNISKINGRDFKETDRYTFSIPSYSAAGGDGYPIIDAVPTGHVDADILFQFFKQKANVSVADYAPTGDIIYNNSDSPLGCQVSGH
ncbi:bifunctional UDP-sugar hydrolase/5'-nucleotidase UshA [Shewanella surugensis]|uniref:Bifunctional UDP-sugar hydrolase/5'-nucleotidase UshA n=1 Tax=Shewanella surugensis TaxID=212020 RepID=A0ABT0LFA9_9GAMM|nr:bifunctional UDP-sugar hydrolase/5'-nucleotidase UshA [Shewanella surugensis]MCL1126358.1 bifunctional UDP-sugar hydrolase/5'-nucleotidase UshA [Shewanella surugensis]